MQFNDRRRDLRLPVIHQCLKRVGTRWTAQQLLKEVNDYLQECDAKPVGIRTIQKDLLYLQALPHNPAPIEQNTKGKLVYYQYAERDYELDASNVDTDQLFALTVAKEVLDQLSGFPLVKEVELLRLKLEKQLARCSVNNHPTILFERNEGLTGLEYLEPLFEAIREKSVVKLSYQPYDAPEPMEKIISPWWLKQSNQRWFLFGWEENLKRLDNSPLDRIIKIRPQSNTYTSNTDVNPQDYFENMVGVTKILDALPETVELKVYGRRRHYVATKSLHQSQEIIESTNDYSFFRYRLIINEEWISRLLSYGHDLEVMTPAWLRERIKEDVFKMGQRYKNLE